MLWAFFTTVTPPTPLYRRSFLDPHGENLVEFLERKPTKNIASSVRLWPPGISYSYSSPYSTSSNSSKLPFKCSCQFISPVTLTSHKQILVAISLWLHCLSGFEGGTLTCNLSSLKNPREVVHFKFISFLILSSFFLDKNGDFQALYIPGLKTDISPVYIFNF